MIYNDIHDLGQMDLGCPGNSPRKSIDSNQATRWCIPKLATAFGGAVFHSAALRHAVALPRLMKEKNLEMFFGNRKMRLKRMECTWSFLLCLMGRGQRRQPRQQCLGANNLQY